MKNKKSRLPAPRFAFAKMDNEESTPFPQQEQEISVANTPERSVINDNLTKSIVERVEYTRITTQVASQIDRQLEYARVMLGKKKQDLINDLLADGLKRLDISFPQL